jgi:hypothetical protein
MRTSPSIVPHGANQDTYLVLDDFGRIGCAWRETNVDGADRETLIRDLVEGQYSKRRAVAAVLSARRQASGDDGWTLCPRNASPGA